MTGVTADVARSREAKRAEPESVQGFVVRLPLFSANKRLAPVVRYRRDGRAYAAMRPTPEYRSWKREAADELLIQRPKPVRGRVAIFIAMVPDTTKCDTDNVIKATLDVLVDCELVEGDTVKTMRRIEVEVWSAHDQLPLEAGQMQVRVRGLPDGRD